MKICFAFPLLIFLLSGLPDVQAQAPSAEWTMVASKDGSEAVGRHEAAFVRVGKRFVLMGGRGIRPVSIYHVKKKKWTKGALPPIEMHHFQPVVYKKKVYVAGALTGPYPGETPVPNIYIYDPKKDRWTKGPAIPSDRLRGAAGAVVDGDRLYLVCGIRDGHRGDHKNWLDRYDFKNNKWVKLADAPRARDHFQATINNGKLYVLGGRLSMAPSKIFSETIAEVDAYDLQTGQWTTLPNDLPTERAGNFVANYGPEILVIGGESDQQEAAHDEVEVLHTQTNQWRKMPPLKQGRHGTGVFIYKGLAYVASGCGKRGGQPELSSMESLRVE